jgi:hypothetical protein
VWAKLFESRWLLSCSSTCTSFKEEEEVMHGSGIQEIVCEERCALENEQLNFWTNAGCDMGEEMLREKRQSLATSSFRSLFESK